MLAWTFSEPRVNAAHADPKAFVAPVGRPRTSRTSFLDAMAPNMHAYERREEPLPNVRPDDFAEIFRRFLVVLRQITNSGGLRHAMARLDAGDVQRLQMEGNLWMATMTPQPVQALSPSGRHRQRSSSRPNSRICCPGQRLDVANLHGLRRSSS